MSEHEYRFLWLRFEDGFAYAQFWHRLERVLRTGTILITIAWALFFAAAFANGWVSL